MPHHPAVVEYVFESRFATAPQIQRRFPRDLRSERTVQYQLANLAQLGYLATAPVRSTSPNFPFVYYATGRGVHLVSDAYAQRGVSWTATATEGRRTKGVALVSILHELMVSEFDLAVWQTVRERDDLRRLWVERRYFRRERQLAFRGEGRRCRVIPDSGFLLEMSDQTSGRSDVHRSLLLHLVELDNGTMPLGRVRRKLELYDLWSRSPEGREYLEGLYREYGGRVDRPNFRLLVIARANFSVCGDTGRLTDLLTQTLELPPAMRDRIWLTSVDLLRDGQDQPSPLSRPAWLRAKDARPWMPEYRKRFSKSAGRRGRRIAAEKRQFVVEGLASLPGHTLFPTQETPPERGGCPETNVCPLAGSLRHPRP